MRRKVLIFVALVGVVAVLVGVNLSMREDPEPEFDPVANPVRPRPRELAVEVEELASPFDGLREPELELPADPGDEGDEPIAGCEHAFVPSRVGQRRTYRWSESDIEGVAELSLRAMRARARTDGQVSITWVVRATNVDDDSELAEARTRTLCVPGESAQEPWFGILERSLGLILTDAPGRWRWPATLAAGVRFDGTATFDPTGSEMRPPEGAEGPQVLRVTRDHVVEAEEDVEVPAGRFHAWRIDYEERYAFGDHGETGTGSLWVAADVGLIKSVARNAAGVVQTMVLTRLENPPAE